MAMKPFNTATAVKLCRDFSDFVALFVALHGQGQLAPP
jgi:hypothetical protein